MLSDKKLLELTSQIYEATMDTTLWQAALKSLSQIFHSNVSALLTQDNRSGIVKWGVTSGMDEKDIVNYASYYGTISPTFFQFQQLGEGSVITDEMHADRRSYTGSEIYNDFFKPLQIERSTTIILDRNGSESTYLAIRRPENYRYRARETETLKQVASHLHRALKIQHLINSENHVNITLSETLDHIKAGVVVLSSSGTVITTNREADRIISNADGVCIRSNRLYLNLGGSSIEAIERLKQQFPSPNTGSAFECTLSVQRPLMRPYIVFAYPLMRHLTELHPQAGMALFITDTERAHRIDALAIEQLFGLTPAESRLTTALAAGLSLQTYCEEANIASSTARSTLKSVFRKTRTSRQPELVKLILSSNISAL